jgi:hypothetical protein
MEELLAFLEDVEASVTEFATFQRQLEVTAQEALNSGEQLSPPSCEPPTADLTEDSPSEEHLDSTVGLKDEAIKVTTKIQELRKVQCEENPVLAANVTGMLNTPDSFCDRETERKEPLSDYLQTGAYSLSVPDVVKELRGSQSSCDSAIDNLVRLADTLESQLRITEEKGKEVLQTQVTCRHKGSRKLHVSENKPPAISEVQTEGHRKQPVSENETSAVSECQTEGLRKQSENKMTAVPQGCIKRLSTVKDRTFRVSENDANTSRRIANSAPVSKWVEKLHNFCKLLQLICENAIATQPDVSSSFLTGADAYAFHSIQCTHLAQASFLNLTFSTQLLAAIENLIDSITACNVKETEARELLSAVRLLTATLPMLQSKFQRMFSDYMFNATRPTTPESVAIWAGYKAGGTEWRTNATCKQLETAEVVAVEAASKLIEALADHDKWRSTSDSDFEEVDVAEAFLLIAKKITSISENVMSLTHAMQL